MIARVRFGGRLLWVAAIGTLLSGAVGRDRPGSSLRAEEAAAAVETAKRPNVLFLAVDDLRPQLGCYGHAHMVTPHLDALAAAGTRFDLASCMVPVCGASRSSLMTGLRPTRSRFRTWNCSTEKDAPGIVPLNAHFLKHGYHTVANGKIFNNPGDSEYGWSEPDWRPGPMRYHVPENQRIHLERNVDGRRRGPATEIGDAPVKDYRDGEVLEKSLADLRRLAQNEQPFFLAVGFYKPHLPFVAPRKCWELYDRGRIELPTTYRAAPKDAPSMALHTFGELRAYSDIPARGPVSDEMAITLIHGYYACVSFIDDLVGTLLDELDRLELRESTIVVLWGDHGWNLGEHTLWCKHCCFETSMRAPLIVRAPGMPPGVACGAPVEFIDIYPSLCELAGLPLPEHLQGTSFVPLLRGDDRLAAREAAIGRYGSGETIRTTQYRYTEFLDNRDRRMARMLYDHHADPDETVNVAEHPANRELVDTLSARLRATRAGKPKGK
jgi:arylsulfatase A-like enzyme